MGNAVIKMRSVCIVVALLLGWTQTGMAQFDYDETPVQQIINDIEQQTAYQFLYREARVSGIKLTFTSTSRDLFATLRRALNRKKLDLTVDSTRHQVIIFERDQTQETQKRISVRGQVVDAVTGERLPFANIIWQKNNTAMGVSANQSGTFKFNVVTVGSSFKIRCSYIGYKTKTVELDVTGGGAIKELTIRLQPQPIEGNELIVVGTNLYSDIAKQANTLVDMGVFSPLGESSTIRALQALPSVSLTTVMNDGLHVRGSPTDGFRVQLDGITIYNQSHLFGLLDSFNSDVLQRSGFVYDIAPAQYQAPPGGMLLLYTKTGSLHEFSGSAGLSNTAARLTLEGPIKKGRSSWLVSGRMSYMDAVNWFNNGKLIEWGLNVDRNKQLLDDDLVQFQSQLVRPGKSDAYFYDLHAKAYFEGKKGSRFVVSGYLGGDHTRQEAGRLYRSFGTDGNHVEIRPVSTQNDWHNLAGSIQYQRWLGTHLYANTTLGVSIYQTAFKKDDFTYINKTNGSLQAFVYPYESESVLNEFKAEQRFKFFSSPWFLTTGLVYHYYMGEYFENSFRHPSYFNSQDTHLVDFYAQLDYIGIDWLSVFGGVRVHYYSNGSYFKWSPRFELELFPDADISVSAGFSRNYQFLNKISLNKTVTSDVWVLANARYAPTSVNYFSAGISYAPFPVLYIQAEAYRKEYAHIRLHALNTFSLTRTFINTPWYSNNSGLGKGIEFMLRNRFGIFGVTQTFTLSEMMLSNPRLNQGKPFYADWDRTYQYMASLYVKPVSNLTFYLSWSYASGTPNKLGVFGSQKQQRLGDYRRTDISVEYRHRFRGMTLDVSLSVFNLLDRQNPWYRELAFVINKNDAQSEFKSVPVVVYDLGLQPSFNISIDF